MSHTHRSGLMVFILLASFVSTLAQQMVIRPEALDRALELYKHGDFAGANKALQAIVKQRKQDITAWHYLGLALGQLGRKDESRKAHEKAARIAEALLDQMVTVPKEQLAEAADSADQFLALNTNLSNRKLQQWRDRSSYLHAFATETSDLKIYTGKEVDAKVRVLSKPEPAYTEEARQNQTMGTVVLRCVFTADGRVRAIHVVSGLPSGLNKSAIVAAQRIRFIPATKDGKPVSMWMELQYNFNLF